MSNVGRTIRDSYCGGFFGREYDMYGAEIIAEGDGWIVIRKDNGKNEFADFQTFDWNRHEDGRLSGGISNLRVGEDMQELIDSWCGDKNNDDV